MTTRWWPKDEWQMTLWDSGDSRPRVELFYDEDGGLTLCLHVDTNSYDPNTDEYVPGETQTLEASLSPRQAKRIAGQLLAYVAAEED